MGSFGKYATYVVMFLLFRSINFSGLDNWISGSIAFFIILSILLQLKLNQSIKEMSLFFQDESPVDEVLDFESNQEVKRDPYFLLISWFLIVFYLLVLFLRIFASYQADFKLVTSAIGLISFFYLFNLIVVILYVFQAQKQYSSQVVD